MKSFKYIDHIGYAVDDIEKTSRLYVRNGWSISDTFCEEIQNAKIAFLSKDGFPTLELVSPLYDKSPIDRILKDNGVSPYHICYAVDDILESIEGLYDQGFMPLFEPIESIAMSNRKICYLFHKDIGLIELVEDYR